MNPLFGYFTFTLTIHGLSGFYFNNAGMIGIENAIRQDNSFVQFAGRYNTTWEEGNLEIRGVLNITNDNNGFILDWRINENNSVFYRGRAIQLNNNQIQGDYDMITN